MVLHVAQLVAEHALDLVAIDQVEEALRDAHHRVRRIAAGGEGVGLLVRRDRQRRHRQTGALAQAVDDGVQLGRVGAA